MRPQDLKQLIFDRFKADIMRPLHVVSSPGLGKTQIMSQAARELKIGFKMIHAPLMQPEDYGFPIISADRKDVSFIVSKDKFPVEGSNCLEYGILGIDELPQADNSGQKIFSQLLQEREIHGQRLKPGWKIVSTGNRTTDRAGANRLLSHLRDRITEVELEASLDDWSNWANDNKIQSEVIAFIRFRPDLLSAFDPQADKSPTPRSWCEGVSADLGIVNRNVEHACFTGSVGVGAATEFVSFLQIYRDLPNPDAILLNPETAPVPKKPAVLYATVGALSNRATPDCFQKLMKYTSRMAPEFTVLFVKDVIRRKPEIAETPTFRQWASTDGAKILT